jgi:hypothetical protein
VNRVCGFEPSPAPHHPSPPHDTPLPKNKTNKARCAHDTVLGHPEYGPVAFSFYTSNIDASMTKRIILVAEPRRHTPICQQIHAARAERLAAAFPAAELVVAGSSRAEDFARLLFAPVLFRDSQSSFGLWAGVASKGQVGALGCLVR